MKLIADSGSSKTEWCLFAADGGVPENALSAGINPFYQELTDIEKVLMELPEWEGIQEVWFYGAGCAGEAQRNKLVTALEGRFPSARVEVESDLLGAARGLCGRSEGLVAILGTGSNSCHYNGCEIVEHVSPLGFILGDEGSGAVLGRKLVSAVFKRQLPADLSAAFNGRYDLSALQVVERVYRRPFPNRFLAGFVPFILEHLEVPVVRRLVRESFVEFFDRNILLYPGHRELPLHFTGSVAWFFRELLEEVALEKGCRLGAVRRSPMEALMVFHAAERD